MWANNEREYDRFERAALMTLWLRQGYKLSSSWLSRKFGIRRDKINRELSHLSRAIPICYYVDHNTGTKIWYWPMEFFDWIKVPEVTHMDVGVLL